MATTTANDDAWDERTAWAALLDDDDDRDSPDRAALVDRLRPAFAAHHQQGKEYVRHALIPVVEHTRRLHDAVHNDIFPRRTLALVALDEANLRFEDAARRDMNAAQTVYDDTKRALDALFTSLDDLALQSDLLFQTFKTSMHEHVERLRRCADQMPVDAERVIASLDKKAKHLGAEDHARAKESLLRGILDKY